MSKEASLNENTRVPLRLVAAAIVATAAFVGEWLDLRHQEDLNRTEIRNLAATMVSEKQFMEWKEDASTENPTVHWPKLPAKDPTSSSSEAATTNKSAEVAMTEIQIAYADMPLHERIKFRPQVEAAVSNYLSTIPLP